MGVASERGGKNNQICQGKIDPTTFVTSPGQLWVLSFLPACYEARSCTFDLPGNRRLHRCGGAGASWESACRVCPWAASASGRRRLHPRTLCLHERGEPCQEAGTRS